MPLKFTILDFDPANDPMLDCSSAKSFQEGYADDSALDGVEEES